VLPTSRGVGKDCQTSAEAIVVARTRNEGLNLSGVDSHGVTSQHMEPKSRIDTGTRERPTEPEAPSARGVRIECSAVRYTKPNSLLQDLFLLSRQEPRVAEPQRRVVWEDGGSNPASYPIPSWPKLIINSLNNHFHLNEKNEACRWNC